MCSIELYRILSQLSERGVHTRLDLLKQHLNYSDLLVIFLYVPSRYNTNLTHRTTVIPSQVTLAAHV